MIGHFYFFFSFKISQFYSESQIFPEVGCINQLSYIKTAHFSSTYIKISTLVIFSVIWGTIGRWQVGHSFLLFFIIFHYFFETKFWFLPPKNCSLNFQVTFSRGVFSFGVPWLGSLRQVAPLKNRRLYPPVDGRHSNVLSLSHP